MCLGEVQVFGAALGVDVREVRLYQKERPLPLRGRESRGGLEGVSRGSIGVLEGVFRVTGRRSVPSLAGEGV
eukprot:213330-Prorocentrum_minimum.AAC.1